MNKIILLLLLFIIIYVFSLNYNVESMDDYGDLEYSKKYKEKLRKNKVFFLEKGFIKNKFINPLNLRINNNMKLLNNAFGIYNNFLKKL
tara:strand:+ start:537 stop:803 length:267 start_codon:yes stop_codon:yes gene_type:complete